jgi:DNA repair exonuclease SbcCD ATPase subunit
MEKEEKKVNDGLKIATIVLALLLAGSLFYIYKISDEAKTTETQLVSEKDKIMADLEALKAEYDIAINEKTALSDELVAEKEKIENLIAELEKANGDLASLQRFKQEAINLRREKESLMVQNETLKKENTKLTVKIDSTNVVLKEAVVKNETLSQENSTLNSTVEKGSQLIVVNPKAEAYKIKSSGKEVLTDKGSRADQIRICFTIVENKIAKEQEKTYYIQVIDIKNNLLGDKKTESFGEQSLPYSAQAKVSYVGKTVNVCEAIVNKDGFPKGSYTVNIFDGSNMISTSTLTLR